MRDLPLSCGLTDAIHELDRLHWRRDWAGLAQQCEALLAVVNNTSNHRDRAVLLLRLTDARSELGELAAAERALTEARAYLAEADVLRARWHLSACLLNYRSGRLDAARNHAHACLACAEALGEQEWLRGSAHSNIGLIAMHRGEWRSAEHHMREAIALLDASGHHGTACVARVNLASVLYWSGQWSAAEEAAQDALTAGLDYDAELSAIQARLLLGNLARVHGHAARAELHLVSAKAGASARGDRRELALAEELAGDLARDRGDLAAAAEAYQRAIEGGLLLAPHGDLVYEGRRKLAEVRLFQGLPAEARTLASEAFDLARAAGTIVEMGAALRIVACAAHALGDTEAAREAAHDALAMLRTSGERYELAQTLCAVASFVGDERAMLIEAHVLAGQLGLDHMMGMIDSRLARLGAEWARTHDPDGASESSTRPRKAARRFRSTLERRALASGAVFLTTDPRILVDIDRAIRNESRVLIEGESGTGKELVAQLLHETSMRARGPFVAIECTSLQESLAQSELFGHVRGSFTGAVADHKGLVEMANGGTLFLDEVGELPFALQARLLRVLQEKRYRPVGASTVRPVDIRVIAATNRSLREEVEAGRFRRDLYYRLRGAMVHIPPLRERPPDIIPLAHHFLDVYGAAYGKNVRLSADVEAVFQKYAWPGNVRQLEYEIENIVAQLEDGAVAHLSVVSSDIIAAASGGGAGQASTFRARMDAAFIEEVQRTLRATGGNRARTAHLMGYSRRGLQKALKRVGLAGPHPSEVAEGELEEEAS
jgi:DNA-binding NtrC family response regulator/tetratricopeptide (TPR) repeat protein